MITKCDDCIQAEYDRHASRIAHMTKEFNCDGCGKRTVWAVLEGGLWGDAALCENCNALMGDRYNFEMSLEEKARQVGEPLDAEKV